MDELRDELLSNVRGMDINDFEIYLNDKFLVDLILEHGKIVDYDDNEIESLPQYDLLIKSYDVEFEDGFKIEIIVEFEEYKVKDIEIESH